MVVLETPRLILRHFVPEDAEALSLILCDHDEGTGLWAVALKADGQFAGDCGLVRRQIDGVAEIEVAYHFDRRQQSRGFATEAARACMEYAFAALGVTRVISLIRAENLPSRRVTERNGMTVEKETMFADLPHLVYLKTANVKNADAGR